MPRTALSPPYLRGALPSRGRLRMLLGNEMTVERGCENTVVGAPHSTKLGERLFGATVEKDRAAPHQIAWHLAGAADRPQASRQSCGCRRSRRSRSAPRSGRAACDRRRRRPPGPSRPVRRHSYRRVRRPAARRDDRRHCRILPACRRACPIPHAGPRRLRPSAVRRAWRVRPARRHRRSREPRPPSSQPPRGRNGCCRRRRRWPSHRCR